MKAPRYDQMRRIYSLYTNDELERAAKEVDGLTDEARNALESELRQRELETQYTSGEPIRTVAQLASDSKTPKTSRWNRYWPVITNEEEAKNAAKSGGYGAAFISVLTSVVSLVAIATKHPVLGVDGWGLVDALMFAVIAWRIFKFSFSWAVVGLLLYSAETYWRWTTVDPPKSAGIVTTSLFFLSLIASVRGTLFLSNDRKSKTKEISAKGAVDDSVESSVPSGRSGSIDLPSEERVTDLYQAWQLGGKEGLRKAYQPEDEK